MIHLTARLMPDEETAQALTDTLAEFANCCRWVHEHSDASWLDMHELRRLMYHLLRRRTTMPGMLCNQVFSSVSAYRKATNDQAVVQGLIDPQKLIFYSNMLAVKGHRVSILLLPGRVDVPYVLEREEDYATAKNAQLKRADLTTGPDGWQLAFQLVPTELVYTPDSITCA